MHTGYDGREEERENGRECEQEPRREINTRTKSSLNTEIQLLALRLSIQHSIHSLRRPRKCLGRIQRQWMCIRRLLHIRYLPRTESRAYKLITFGSWLSRNVLVVVVGSRVCGWMYYAPKPNELAHSNGKWQNIRSRAIVDRQTVSFEYKINHGVGDSVVPV